MSVPLREAELAEAKIEYDKQKVENDEHQCTSRCNKDKDCYAVEVFPDFDDWLLEQ